MKSHDITIAEDEHFLLIYDLVWRNPWLKCKICNSYMLPGHNRSWHGLDCSSKHVKVSKKLTNIYSLFEFLNKL